MSQVLVFIVAGLGFFNSSSVSFAERSDALWVNPAGLALHAESVELQSGLGLIDDNTDLRFGLAAGASGFGYRTGDSTGVWSAGLALPLGKRFRLGGAYNWGEQKFWNFGLQANPLNWMALGACIRTGQTPVITGGLGVRPFTDRITLFSDLTYRDGGVNLLSFGAGIEPISGVLLYGSTTLHPPSEFLLGPYWEAGAEFSFRYVKLGTSYNSDGNLGIGVGVSFPRYPGIRLKRPGPKVVAWVPKGRPEGPEARGFKFAFISFSMKKSKTFYDLLKELRSLGERKDVKGILLDFREAGISGYQMEEVRTELSKLKDKGIKIVAFSEGYSIGSYYLASLADRVWMVPTGEIILTGLFTRTLHIKGTLDKLGIEPDFYRVGEYKSAYEMVEFTEPSKEDREQLEAYLSSLYDEILGAIERDRGIRRSELESFINERIIVEGDTAKALGLVDDLCLALELDSLLEAEFGKGAERTKLAKLSQEPREVPRSWVDSEKGIPGLSKVAIVVAEGSIVTGESSASPLPIPLLGGKYMGSTTISELLEEVAKDKQVKAVVFRINSGGGSALASEIINRALTELAAAKPVVVSMGDVAGSGGYYIAAPAEKIYADAFTVTGSIGILGGKFVTKGFNEKLGITRSTVKLYPHADMFSPDRPFDEAETRLMQRMMDQGYAEFVNRVAEGRGMTFDEVDSVARGRIWSGPGAVEAGLADEVGGLMDALDEARRMAGLPEDVQVVIYPKPEPMIDIEEVLDETSILNLKMLPSWLFENLLYIVPYKIEVPMD